MVKKNSSTVELKVNGQTYKLTCNQGEEDHLIKLGNLINEEMENLIVSVGKIDQNRLLLMVGILIADKYDALLKDKFHNINDEIISKLSKAVEGANSRIELVAEKLSKI